MTALVLVGLGFLQALGTPSVYGDYAFGEPVNLGPVINSSSGDSMDCILADGLEMYIDTGRSGGYGGWDIWVTRRPTTDAGWGPLRNLGSAVNSSSADYGACLSADELTLYFYSDRGGGLGRGDIWMTTRASKNDPWREPTNLGSKVNTSDDESWPWISTDGLELYFVSKRPGGYGGDDIWVAKRSTPKDPWTEPVNLGPTVNSIHTESMPCLSVDGLLLFFCGSGGRPGGVVSRRRTLGDSWGAPLTLEPIAASYNDTQPRISPDGSTLYFSSERPGGLGGWYGDIWQAPIIPIVDFNGDGKVDGREVLAIAEHWGQDEQSCDVGPTPFGDGIVAVKDLTVLAGYIGKKVVDPTLVAHWALDETEGTVAHDTAGQNDAFVIGRPSWQPDGGIVEGALACDGVDDCLITKPVVELSEGHFSVFAWVKGGAPGQVVISQQGKASWLLANPVDGSLMTKLTGAGQTSTHGVSKGPITDGAWHRIGLVWDGAKRILYVDDKEVARDAQSQLVVTENGLVIGSDMTPGSFWSGLIDDVRIYDRAVKP
jgi:dipeptidyl aminopeptidase/acylaminoacyl peptidase